MFHLTLTVISIVLLGLTGMATMKYVNPTLPIVSQAENRTFEGFRSFESAWNKYRLDNETYTWECQTFETDTNVYEDCRMVLDSFGYLPVSGWSTALIPTYLFLPRAPMGMSWSYGSNSAGLYFCLTGNPNEAQLRGIWSSADKLMVNQAIINESCGEITTDAAAAGDIAVTYWVQRN